MLTEEKAFVACSNKSVYSEVGLLSRTFLDLCNTGRGNRSTFESLIGLRLDLGNRRELACEDKA